MTFFASGNSAPSRYSLGCACELKGYRIATIRGGVQSALSGLGNSSAPKVALIPVSDPKAVTAVIRRIQQASGKLSDSAQVQNTASLAMTGAKAGSIIPGVGTVIGAVVGAVAGWVTGKKPPVRPSPQQVQQCRQLLNEYMSMAAQSPDVPMPLDEEQLTQIAWCINAVYGAEVGLRDPRWFTPGYTNGNIPMAKELVKKIYDTPVGGKVSVGSVTFRDPKGKVYTYPQYDFTNPPFVSIKKLAIDIFTPMWIKTCGVGRKDPHVCDPYIRKEVFQRLVFDTLGMAARTVLPNISEADLREASKVAVQTGTSASAVVQAVEQIIGKTVARNQTAELLNPGSSTAPPPSISTTQVGPAVILPGTPSIPETLPGAGVTPGAATDTKALIEQLIGQGATNQQAFTQAMNSLVARGVTPTGIVQATVANEVQAAARPWYQNPLYIGGGVAALFGAVLLLRARPLRAR